ncbi:PEP/pyruvate-binding domain-containing protein [Halorubrum sp. PV6]|uniref:PEP/pyruvate-binding domain-containing protein n=1 Tax=Halorubrum sp. PV6 TaxID=634157 RepID=UPI0011986F22|nr:PEP/pyruvate-binding domain-containing protein [Halorubrum sp. PV6]AZQ16114.1 pyruvate phosphate dikinase [Halorubrum sp. PV6]
MTTEIPTTYTKRFGELGRDDLALAGGKGANLGELVGAGLPVPPGFVVTTEAYRSLIDTSELRDAIAELEALDETDTEAPTATAEQIRSLVREQEFSEEIERSIADVLTADSSYAVRSSATAEDLPSASFAGQHDTSLGVSTNDVLDAVRDCMASLFTDRAVAYRARNGISHSAVEMAVVVQEMADADAAGVLFTADPDSGKRGVASVEATYGLGETVVSGEVSADNARIDKATGEILDYDIGEKATERRLTDDGTETEETTEERRREQVLSDAQLRTLVDLGTRIEKLFGEPQDIEWALADGEFVILQSRPITSLVSLPEPRPDDDRLHVYLSMGHAQAMTDPMPPLALDIWETVYGGMLNDYTGGDRAWITRTEGRIYMDITPFLGFGVARDGIVESISVISESAAEGTVRLLDERREEFGGEFSVSSLPTVLRKLAGALPLVVGMTPGMVREGVLPFFRGAAGTEEYVAEFNAWAKTQEAQVLDAEGPNELVENAFAGFPAEFLFEMTPKSVRVIVGPVAGGLLERVVPGVDAALVDAAARGAEQEVGTRMTLALGDLADLARETPAVEQAILDEQPYEKIREIEGSGPFVEGFEAFLDDFGHRAAGEFDPSRPRWRDDPATPIGIIRGNLIREQKGAHRERLHERKRQAQDTIDELQANARRGLFGPVRRPLASHLIRTYRSHIHLRDEPKHAAAHLFAAWHEALQRAGEHLVAEGVLTETDDVWFLRRDELLALIDDPSGDLPDIDVRRRDHERHKRVDVPPLITSEGEIPRAEREDVGANTLVGTGVSSGIIEGTARIVHDPANANLQSGDILVCPSSDPAWTPLFATAGGIVTEVGGRLTHGALVAREYGLPAVVSVTNATELIADGQRIRVDGDTGTVNLLN